MTNYFPAGVTQLPGESVKDQLADEFDKIDELIKEYEFSLETAGDSLFPHIDIYIRFYKQFLKELNELKETL